MKPSTSDDESTWEPLNAKSTSEIAKPPSLNWGYAEANLNPAVVARMGLQRAKRLGEVGARGGGTDSSPRIGTPEPFRNLLISMARSAHMPKLEAAE